MLLEFFGIDTHEEVQTLTIIESRVQETLQLF